jgi:hypothetical protein
VRQDTPNVVMPLAASYNERGTAGFTSTLTTGLDQRKINCIYKPVANAMTGKSTLYMSRRPGVTNQGASWGTSGQTAYLVTNIGAASAGTAWVFSTSGSDIRVSDLGSTTVIFTDATYQPSFVDRTPISGTDTVVLQARKVSAFNQRVFYASAVGSWTEITDGDFPATTVMGKMEFMDGFAFALSTANKIHNSDLNSLADWTAGNYITKQIQQDSPSGLAKYKNQILAFGTSTVEVFTNAGNAAGSPLVSQKQLAETTVGIGRTNSISGATHYYATVMGVMFFVGQTANTTRSKVLFAYNGSRFEKVSTPFIDSILSSATVYSVSAVEFHGRSAVAIGLDSTSATTQRWLMFFPEWREWFEWTSAVFKPSNNCRDLLGVDQNQHKLYFFDNTDNWQDDSTNYTRTVQFKMPKDGNKRKFMRWCGVSGDTARSAQSLTVEFSDDDDQTFATSGAIDCTLAKPQIYRCGTYRTRTVRLTDSGNFEGRLESFLARVE